MAAPAAPTPGEWQTSLPVFAAMMLGRREDFGPPHMGGTLGLFALINNQGCARRGPLLADNLPLRLRGTFRGLAVVEASVAEVHRASTMVNIELADHRGTARAIVARIYAADDAVEAWRSFAPSADIEFTANVQCAANFGLLSVRCNGHAQ